MKLIISIYIIMILSLSVYIYYLLSYTSIFQVLYNLIITFEKILPK